MRWRRRRQIRRQPVRFSGVAHIALDAKGRVSIPARHRDALSQRTNGSTGHAPRPHCRSERMSPALPAWCESIQSRLMALSSFNAPIRRLQRLLVGHADDVDMDNAGRILVSPALRQYAGLEHRAVLVGQGNKFELWDEALGWRQTSRPSRSRPAICRRN
jgi:MraZ protein